MEREYLIKKTLKVFEKVAVNLITPNFKVSMGGATMRVVGRALDKIEKKEGDLSEARIVDYVISSAYAFKDRGSRWTINQIFGPKSLERLSSSRGQKFYEDKWLKTAGLVRADLVNMITNKSVHPQSKYVYMAMEESTKSRMLNTEAGYIICQVSTLGWSPLSPTCADCQFVEKCKIETQGKYPEIYRLRLEYGSKK